MPDKPPLPPLPHTAFGHRVGEQAARRLQARRDGSQGVWSGMGMMGMVGWSVAIPTLLGATAGAWIDRHSIGAHSWVLALLVAGLCVGCAHAWYWVSQENVAIHQEVDPDDFDE